MVGVAGAVVGVRVGTLRTVATAVALGTTFARLAGDAFGVLVMTTRREDSAPGAADEPPPPPEASTNVRHPASTVPAETAAQRTVRRLLSPAAPAWRPRRLITRCT